MPKRYARGRYATGECARSGRKMLLKDMVSDGYYPSLVVDPAWYESKHPQESLPEIEDPVSLWRPAPERDQIDGVVNIIGGGGDTDIPPGGGFGDTSNANAAQSVAFGYEVSGPSFSIVQTDGVFIRDAGAIYDHHDYPNLDGVTALDIPDREAGDLLVAITTSQSTAAAESGTNYVERMGLTDSRYRAFERIATNDANDSFSMQASGDVNNAMRSGQCISLASGDIAKTVTFLEFSAARTEAGGGNFVRAELQKPTQDQVLSLGLGQGTKNLFTGVHDLTPPDNNLYKKGYGYNTGIDRSYWVFYGWRYQDTAILVPEEEVPHTPNAPILNFVSQWLTFHAT